MKRLVQSQYCNGSNMKLTNGFVWFEYLYNQYKQLLHYSVLDQLNLGQKAFQECSHLTVYDKLVILANQDLFHLPAELLCCLNADWTKRS